MLKIFCFNLNLNILYQYYSICESVTSIDFNISFRPYRSACTNKNRLNGPIIIGPAFLSRSTSLLTRVKKYESDRAKAIGLESRIIYAEISRVSAPDLRLIFQGCVSHRKVRSRPRPSRQRNHCLILFSFFIFLYNKYSEYCHYLMKLWNILAIY